MAALQQWRVAPLILAAEVYEGQDDAAVPHDHAAVANAAHEHDEGDWKPEDGVERIAYTIGADLLAAVGFALLLAAASTVSGIEVTPLNGVLWGLAGFAVFQLAPAFSLPPELPGMPAADLGARQIWWLGCALATATAIFGIVRFRTVPAIVVGVVLLLLPHVIGAPAQPDEQSGVPAHLATSFAAASLGAGAVFWLLIGPLYGWLLQRFSQTTATASRKALA